MDTQDSLTTPFAYDDDDNGDEVDISIVLQPMCKPDYNVTIDPNFPLYLAPGTTFACSSILLNLAVFLTFTHMR